MNIVTDIASLRQSLAPMRNQKIALVPTMGNLHEGHLELVRKARTVAEKTVVSIFVNPLQFGPNEDFDTYPRTPESDAKKLESLGVDFIFAPCTEEMFPDSINRTSVAVPGISDELCGKFRPGFFYGITTNVAKLFNIVQPNIAVFGQKDYQQLHIITKMVADLAFPIEILSVPTAREEHSLAMSSRNQYLTHTENKEAAELYRTLVSLRDSIVSGNPNYPQLINDATRKLTLQNYKVDYISIRNKETLSEANGDDKSLVILIAAWLRTTRLIDNIFVDL